MGNFVLLTNGRLTKNGSETVKASGDDKTIARFTVAIDRNYKKDGETPSDFISCVSFDNKRNAFIRDKITTKMKVNVIGHLQTGAYENKDGQKVYTTDVVVDQIEVADWGDGAKADAQGSVPVAQPAPAPQQAPVQQAAPAPQPQVQYGQTMYAAPQQVPQPTIQAQTPQPAPAPVYGQPPVYQAAPAPQVQYQAPPVTTQINPNEKGFI